MRDTRPARTGARLSPELLEDRAVPALMTTWVNDNWNLFLDADNSGGLSAGDVVTSANDPGPVTGYFYGTQAFGTVTSGINVTAPQSLPGAATIQDAVANTTAGGTVNVFGGTYNEDVNLNKALTLLGVGADTTTISGAIGGDSATIRVGASNVTVAGLTITRQGNTVADWNNPNLNSAGIAVQGQAVSGLTVRDNVITGNRTGIDVNDSSAHIIRNNVITANRTGLIFRNQTNNLVVTENAITGNFTVGIVFLDASAGTNSPPQQALNSSFTGNNISGNWYGQIVDRQAGGALPAPGTTNLKDFSGNWFGTAAPTVTSADSTEPGYAAQIPVQFGGTATAPAAPQFDIAGPASANFDISPLLTTGVDTDAQEFGFQGDFSKLTVTQQLASIGGAARIQEGVDRVTPGGTVSVPAGTYAENVNIGKNVALVSVAGRATTIIQGVAGVNALGTIVVTNNTTGVTIGGLNQGFTVVGIDNGFPGIENAAVYFQGNHTGAKVIGNEIVANGDEALITEFSATVSGFVIDSNVFSGQTFVGPNPATGDQFAVPNVPRQLVVIGNGGGDAASALATNITFTNNQITGTAGGLLAGGGEQGNSLATIDAANSTITGNTFNGTTTRFGASLRVRRPGTTIAGNTFLSANMAAGTEHLFVQNNTATLQAIVAANTFDRGAYVDGGSDLSVSLNGGAGRAASGQTLRVLAGTYNESLNLTATGAGALNKALTVSPDGGAVSVTGDLTLDANDALVLDVSGAKPDQFSVTGALTLGGALTVNGLAGVPANTPVTLIANGGADAVSGAAVGAPSGTTFTAADGRQFTLTYTGGTGNDVVLVPVADVVVTPTVTPTFLTAVGADAGANGHVKVYNADGSLRFSFFAFDGFNGGVRVATGDLNGDGTDDIVVGAGAGAPGGHVKVFDGATGLLIRSFFSFDGFSGGVNVAVGDVDGNGTNDLVVGTGSGASHVKAFDFASGALLASFLAFDPGYTGGVTVAAGDFDGAGADEIVVGAATTAGHVKVFNQAGGAVASFFAFASSNGVTVAAGDLDGDGAAELIVGSGPGAPGQVNVFEGKTGAARGSTGAIAGTNGARVAVGFANGDAVLDILVGTGAGAAATVRSFNGQGLAPIAAFTAFDGFQGGLYVG